MSAIIREERIGGQRLILGDCLAVMPELGRFDAVVTDPPYGIGASRGVHSNLRMADKDWDDFTPRLDWLADAASDYIVWGGNYFSLPPSRCFLIWDKSPMPPSYAFGEMATTSLDKNAAKWCGKVGDTVPVRERSHPTQKPVALMEWCLGFLPDARTILDPFAGSGTTAVACERMGRQCTAIELDPDYFEIMCRRVDEATRQPDLLLTYALPQPQQESLL